MSRWYWLVTFVDVDGEYVREGFEDYGAAALQYLTLEQTGHRPTIQEMSEDFRKLVSAPIAKTYKWRAAVQ